MEICVTAARTGDADELAAVAAVTFPLACPDTVATEDIAAFIDAHLAPERFVEYLADPDRMVLAATDQSRIIGYTMLIRGADGIELSKMYVLPSHHGSGAAAALIQSALNWAADTGAGTVWLGVNQNNVRAQQFYRKHGFDVTGTRTFQLGGHTEHDFVMARRV